MNKDIYKMKLHDEIIVYNNDMTTHSITRVAGGWIYTKSYDNKISEVFVPFNNEFQNV